MQNADSLSVVIDENTALWSKPNQAETITRIQRILDENGLLRILGPCALQSLEQAEAILRIISGNADLVRAPGEKPRTRPVDSKGKLVFDGIGLDKARAIYEHLRKTHPHIGIASEVMSPKSMQAIGENLGLGWVGARSQQPELVQNLARAAADANLPLMIKNTLTGNMTELVGMLEHAIVGSEGKIPVIACVRGRHPVNGEGKDWRNVPNLELVEDLRREFPDLPIIIDPSHMPHKNGDKRGLDPEVILQIVSEAVDMGANGYMIEVSHQEHPSLTDPGTEVETILNLLAQANLA